MNSVFFLRRRRQSGFLLYLTLVALALFAVLFFELLGIYREHSRKIAIKQDSERAYYIARIGLVRAEQELEKDIWWSTSGPSSFSLPGDAGSYTVAVWAPSTNRTAPGKIWKVTSIGKYHGISRTIVAWLALESFSTFAYFTDTENPFGQTLWFTDQDRIQGRVHTNGYFNISGHPQFSGKVTSHNRNDNFYNPEKNVYEQNGKLFKDPSRFYHCFSGYQSDEPVAMPGSEDSFTFAGGQKEIILPDDMSKFEVSSDKVYNGTVLLKFMDTGKVQVKYKVADKWEFDHLDTKKLTIHIKGKAILEGGILKGKCTITASDDIEITNDLKYADPRSDILGAVAEKDVIIKTDPQKRQDLNLSMVVMALKGSFYVDKYNEGVPRGYINIFGGVIQKIRGPLGTFKSGNLLTGYNMNYQYDEKLMYLYPPNFPTTGRVIVISIHDMNTRM